VTRSGGWTLRLEVAAYLVIFLAAAGVRLTDLGWPPLSDAEARHALAASALVGRPAAFDPAPGTPPPGVSYRVATALLFQLFGSGEATARVVPALAGVALCMLPLLARRRLGAGGALALSGLLSFSPELVTVSRQAGPTSLAILGLVGFVIILVGQETPAAGDRRSTLAIVFAALALTSGSEWIQGVVGLMLGTGLLALWRGRQRTGGPVSAGLSFTRRQMVIGLLTVIGISTAVGLYPRGASDPFEAIAAWLTRWSGPAVMPILSEILVVPAYEPILFIFGLIGTVLAFRRKDQLGVVAAFWAVGALFLAAIYPGRTGLDLAWVVVPAAYLASCGAISAIEWMMTDRAWYRLGGMMAAYIALAAFIYLQAAAYASDLTLDLPPLEPTVRLVILLIGLLIWAVLFILFGTGWSWAAAGGALAAAIFSILSAVSIASIARLNFGSSAAEGGHLWKPTTSAVGLQELDSTLGLLSRAYREDPGGLTISLSGSAPPSLAWTIRGFDEAPASATDLAPPVVLAPSDTQPALHADYLGQLLAIAETNDWDGAFPPDVVSWWLLRRAPIRLDDWLLLVRADVATQGGLTALGSETNP
jgi:hypothetical protein